jgi:membrane protein implicated in regulation of membrane protease activity
LLAAGVQSSPGSGRGAVLNLRTLRVIRLTRLVRVIRIIRIVQFVHALRSLVYSISCTLRSLVWSLVLLLVIIYVFAILFTLGVEDVIADSSAQGELNDEDLIILKEYWGSLPSSMFTLWAAITNGMSWADVMLPLGSVGFLWALLFTLYIAFVMFAVLNVMTGVFCQSAIESAARDRELSAPRRLADRRTFMQNARSFFNELDREGSGKLSFEDMEARFDEPKVKAWLDALDIDTDDAWSFYKLIQQGSENEILLDEFVMGCVRLKGGARSIDVAHLMYEHRWLVERFLLIMQEQALNSRNDASSRRSSKSDL